ncbi:ribose 5-phosphate isomerase B [Leptospira ilyithenensis]|uniref:Ribose 5-phosphate isomerase B n=1 Tax=Leptospira ilyithenensis TaxID=2484901 RepID=A0A4R9LSB6_9LEPT|nr:ribose 5-phosphate isomerase B [Leptospira ilyithenensis]TGN10233.1 ribose 5-phosphate isomerase B [Leptospira ilyithenensis]
MKPKLGIASDHGGFALKEFLRKSLEESFEVVDYGTKSEASVDYPTIIGDACRKVLAGEVPRLIALCGTGIGASIAANRIPGIRAALCHDEFTAEMSRRHNNANVIVLGGRVLGTDLALRIVQKWIDTDFEGGRHERRLGLVEEQKP